MHGPQASGGMHLLALLARPMHARHAHTNACVFMHTHDCVCVFGVNLHADACVCERETCVYKCDTLMNTQANIGYVVNHAVCCGGGGLCAPTRAAARSSRARDVLVSRALQNLTRSLYSMVEPLRELILSCEGHRWSDSICAQPT